MARNQSSRTKRGDRPARPRRESPQNRSPSRSPASPHTRNTARPLNLTLDLYGLHAVEAALLNAERIITAIYAIDEQAEHLADICDRARASRIKRPEIHIAPRAAFDASLPREAVHQGVGVSCDPLPDVSIEDIINTIENTKKRGVIVILDQVTDPHNMGAIIRSATVFGAAGMVVQRRNAPDLNALIAKTACGGVEHLPVAYETNLARTLETLKDAGFFVAGLDERGEDLTSFTAPEKCVLVLGAEGPGLRRLVKDGCDRLIRLPTPGPISSLNVSNAAAVALYHICTK